MLEAEFEAVVCPNCDNENIEKVGKIRGGTDNHWQRVYRCRSCGRSWVEDGCTRAEILKYKNLSASTL